MPKFDETLRSNIAKVRECLLHAKTLAEQPYASHHAKLQELAAQSPSSAAFAMLRDAIPPWRQWLCAAGIVDESGTAATGVMANTSSEVSTILNEYKDTIALQQAVEEWFAICACIVILGDSTAKDEAKQLAEGPHAQHIPTCWMASLTTMATK